MLLVIVKTYPVPSGHLRGARKGWRSGCWWFIRNITGRWRCGGPRERRVFYCTVYLRYSFVRTKGDVRAFVDRAPQHETIVAQVWRLVVGGGCRVYFAPVQGEAKAKTTTTTTPQVRKYIGDYAQRIYEAKKLYKKFIYISIHTFILIVYE